MQVYVHLPLRMRMPMKVLNPMPMHVHHAMLQVTPAASSFRTPRGGWSGKGSGGKNAGRVQRHFGRAS